MNTKDDVFMVLKSYLIQTTKDKRVPSLSEFVRLNTNFIARLSKNSKKKFQNTWKKRFLLVTTDKPNWNLFKREIRHKSDIVQSYMDLSDIEDGTESETDLEETIHNFSHLNCKQVSNKKAGQYRLSPKGQKEIELAYIKMKENNIRKLSTRKLVKKELYKLGKTLKFEHPSHSFIIDVNYEVIKKHFNDVELQEIEFPSPEVPDLSEDIIRYLNTFMDKNSASDMCTVLNKHNEIFDKKYDPKIHHDLDFIRFAIYAIEIESGNLKHSHLEEWFNLHIWHAIFNQGFLNFKNISVIGHRGDWILRRTGNGNRLEYGAGEVGRIGEDEFRTKNFKGNVFEIAKNIKKHDFKAYPESLIMTILYIDVPKEYICRIRRSEVLEIPDKEENLLSVLAVLAILAAVLNIKIAVKKTIEIIESREKDPTIFKNTGKPKR
ncbi:22758_t:CDS:10, partial [Racocetra persica]